VSDAPGSRGAILLDALGTLVALQPPAPLLRRELDRRFAVDVTVEQAAHAIAAEIKYYRAHLGEGRDAASLQSLRRSCAVALRGALPREAAAIGVDDLTEALLASITFTAFPDVAPTLGALRARGTRLVVVSNWDFSLHDVLDRLGITALLDGVVTSAEHGSRKPDPAIFARGLELAAVGPREALHVGDSLDEDVAGARAAAIEPVLIRRDASPGPPGTWTITSLSELARDP
jgi:putative hydrolase of the HAD superfamily